MSAASASVFLLLEETASTNAVLMADLEADPFSVVVTLNQRLGRGRLSREWHNLPGEGLALSVLVPPTEQSEAKNFPDTLVPLVAGYCVVRALRDLGFHKSVMKWPNDVLVGGRKLAGILCEARLDRSMVVGIGVNLRFASERPHPNAVSLADLAQLTLGIEDDVTSRIVANLRLVLEKDRREQLQLVTSVLDTLGREVEVIPHSNRPWVGRAMSVTEDGGLEVVTEHGERRTVVSSDIVHLNQ